MIVICMLSYEYKIFKGKKRWDDFWDMEECCCGLFNLILEYRNLIEGWYLN